MMQFSNNLIITIINVQLTIVNLKRKSRNSIVPLPLSYFPWLIGILIAYSFLTQIVKGWYIRKFNDWL